MKKIFVLITILFLSTVFVANAQRHEKDEAERKEFWDKLQTEKISFLTKALDLTPAEAQKFWPTYNQLDKERMEAQSNRRSMEHKVRDAEDNLSDDDVVKLTREFAGSMLKEGEMMKDYNEKFLKILNPQKVLKLYQAENEFKMYMIRQYREKGKNRLP